MANPYIVRFQVGKTYRLHTSPDFDRLRGGTLVVKAELKPSDRWGNRILLVDAFLDPKTDGTGNPVRIPIGSAYFETELHLGSRCFVEEGYATRTDSFGSRTIPAEVATLQGIYPDFAKAYAIDEVVRMPNPTNSSKAA